MEPRYEGDRSTFQLIDEAVAQIDVRGIRAWDPVLRVELAKTYKNEDGVITRYEVPHPDSWPRASMRPHEYQNQMEMNGVFLETLQSKEFREEICGMYQMKIFQNRSTRELIVTIGPIVYDHFSSQGWPLYVGTAIRIVCSFILGRFDQFCAGVNQERLGEIFPNRPLERS